VQQGAAQLKAISKGADMLQVTEQDAAPDTIQATVNYILNTGEAFHTHTVTVGGKSTEVRSGMDDPRCVAVRNGRLSADRFAIDSNGFRFVRRGTKVIDFLDEDELRKVYYPEIERLIKVETGASRVVIFDHTLRTANHDLVGVNNVCAPVPRVHNDNTERSGPDRVREVLPQEAEQILRRRFSIVQVWRPIRYPVETFPLGVVDARSFSPDDLIISTRLFSTGQLRQMYVLTYNPGHRWFWFPRMQRDEAIVFKTYESLRDGRSRWTPHAAFCDPTSPPDARARESVEIRAFALF
jgi:hypothetical protein